MAADVNAPKKHWWGFLTKEVIAEFAVALGLDILFKHLKEKGAEKTAQVLTEKMFYEERAKILDDFRRMETATPPINVDNLWRRHQEAIDNPNVTENRFITLLCKTIADKKDPTKGRQDTLKWLNDMDDVKFNQALYILEDDRFYQWGNKAWGRVSRDVKRLRASIRSDLGVWGTRIEAMTEAIWAFLLRFLCWLNHSWLRVVAMAILSLPFVIFMALIISPIRRKVFPWLGSVFSWLGIANAIVLIAIAYYLLVPTHADKNLSLAGLMLLAAAFLLWRATPIRNILFCILCVFTLILFLGGRTAAKNDVQKAFAEGVASSHQNNDGHGNPLASPSPSGERSAVSANNTSAPPSNNYASAAKTSDSESGEAGGTSAPPPTAPAKQEPIYPLTGNKGIIVPVMYDCYYSAGNVVTCEGSAQNNDDVEHGVYLMDSQGVVNTQTGGEQFSVWTFGGSIQFTGGTDFARLIPGMQSPFIFSFRENSGKAKLVGITLFLKSAADSLNHSYTFSNIPVRDHRL